MAVIETAGQFAPDHGTGRAHYAEHLRSADLSVGTYSIPAGGADGQSPHTEDEIYVVTAGAATFVVLVVFAGSASQPAAVAAAPTPSSVRKLRRVVMPW